MAPTPIRIALLICDTPIDDVVKVYGEYHSIFTALLTRSLPEGVGKDRFVLDPYDVEHKMEYPPADLEGYDAIMLTGSVKSAYQESEWIDKLVTYVKDVAERKPKVKIIGICFGHQIIARALGGTCVSNNGVWEIGPSSIKLSEVGKRVFGGAKETLNIQQCHRDHVPVVPTHPFPFQCLGSSDICANQGMVLFEDPASALSQSSQASPEEADKALLRQIRIFTLQGHPEFHASIVKRILDTRERSGVLPHEVAGDARKWNKLEVAVPGVIAAVDEEGMGGSADGQGWVNDGREIGQVVWGILGL